MTKVSWIWILSNLLNLMILFSKNTEFNEVHLWLIKSITDCVVNIKIWYATMSCDNVINESRNRFACHD